jgi:hypothetical protein
MDSDLCEKLRCAAKEKGISQSSIVSNALREYFNSGWPKEFFESIGSIDDETFEVPEEPPWSLDAPRKW